jgi:hypothetical protein
MELIRVAGFLLVFWIISYFVGKALDEYKLLLIQLTKAHRLLVNHKKAIFMPANAVNFDELVKETNEFLSDPLGKHNT